MGADNFQIALQRLRLHFGYRNIDKLFGPKIEFSFMFNQIWKLKYLDGYLDIKATPIAKKNDSLAEENRKLGNNFFKAEDFGQALELYNQSIIYASQNGINDISNLESVVDELSLQDATLKAKFNCTNLAFGFANRSAVLFKLNIFKACLQDTHRALLYGYPLALKPKLIERQAKCFLAFKEVYNAVSLLEQYIASDCPEKAKDKMKDLLLKCQSGVMPELYIKENKELIKKICGSQVDVPALENRNPKIPALSNSVTIESVPGKGRGLIATQDIMPGEIIAIEEHYCSVLDENNLSICSTCFLGTKILVPCPFCTMVVFCSEKCLQSGFKQFHHLECELSLVNLPRHMRLIFRILAQISFPELKQEVLKSRETMIETEKRGFGDDGVYHSNQYRPQIYQKTHKESRNSNDLFTAVVQSSYLLKLLSKSTYFENCSKNEQVLEKDIMFLGEVIFNHLLSFGINAFDIYSNLPGPQKLCITLNYNVLSLLNHSCFPNAFTNPIGKLHFCRSFVFISKGEEITIPYFQRPYFENGFEKNIIEKKAFFTCNCIACQENWPLLPKMNPLIRFACPNCSTPINLGARHCDTCKVKTSTLRIKSKEQETCEFANVEVLFDEVLKTMKTLPDFKVQLLADPFLSNFHLQYVLRFIYLISRYFILPSRDLIFARKWFEDYFELSASGFFFSNRITN